MVSQQNLSPALEFTATTPRDQTALTRFLISAFHSTADAPFVDPNLLAWKYFESRPGHVGSRSYIFRQGEKIVAHGAVYPVSFLTGNGEVTSCRVIDWAADVRAPGAGLSLFRNVAAMRDSALAVGGTPQTLEILPNVGFEHRGNLDIYARVVRPARQVLAQRWRNWKVPLRFARNFCWSLRPYSSRCGHWSATRVESFDEALSPVIDSRRSAPWSIGNRSIPLLNYYLRCPVGNVTGFLLFRNSRLQGYFILSSLAGQSRIADLWITSPNPDDWSAAIGLAARVAAADPACVEIMAAGSVDLVRRAFESNGFVMRRRDPILILDPRESLPKAVPLFLTLIDGDEWLVRDPENPYLT